MCANGATGLGHTDGVTTPQRVVSAQADARVVRIACGMLHTYTLVKDGRVFGLDVIDSIPTASRQGTPQPMHEGALAACTRHRLLGKHAAFTSRAHRPPSRASRHR